MFLALALIVKKGFETIDYIDLGAYILLIFKTAITKAFYRQISRWHVGKAFEAVTSGGNTSNGFRPGTRQSKRQAVLSLHRTEANRLR